MTVRGRVLDLRRAARAALDAQWQRAVSEVEEALLRRGVKFLRTKVGDRYVHQALLEKGGILGGETSGHILCLDRVSSGDGVISALQVLEVLAACMRHSRPIAIYLQSDDVVVPLTVFPLEHLAHAPIPMQRFMALPLANLVVLRVGEVQLFRGLGGCRFERANEKWKFASGNAWHTAFAGNAAGASVRIGCRILSADS